MARNREREVVLDPANTEVRDMTIVSAAIVFPYMPDDPDERVTQADMRQEWEFELQDEKGAVSYFCDTNPIRAAEKNHDDVLFRNYLLSCLGLSGADLKVVEQRYFDGEPHRFKRINGKPVNGRAITVQVHRDYRIIRAYRQTPEEMELAQSHRDQITAARYRKEKQEAPRADKVGIVINYVREHSGERLTSTGIWDSVKGDRNKVFAAIRELKESGVITVDKSGGWLVSEAE